MKLISTLIFLLCVTFAFAECYDNHFDECRIERQNGKYGIVIDKQLAVVDMTASTVRVRRNRTSTQLLFQSQKGPEIRYHQLFL